MSAWISKYMAVIVLAVAAIALFLPKTFLWIQTSWINILLMIIMFGLGLILKLETPKKKALSIEVGMQNSGLATSLAQKAFPDLAMATVPGAIFSVWHNISGAVLANVLRRIR